MSDDIEGNRGTSLICYTFRAMFTLISNKMEMSVFKLILMMVTHLGISSSSLMSTVSLTEALFDAL